METKLQELKQKQTEYSKACREKDKIEGEVKNLKTTVETHRSKRSEVETKWKEDKSTFNAEKKKLQISEQVLKKRERVITNNFNKLEHQLTNKEKVSTFYTR